MKKSQSLFMFSLIGTSTAIILFTILTFVVPFPFKSLPNLYSLFATSVACYVILSLFSTLLYKMKPEEEYIHNFLFLIIFYLVTTSITILLYTLNCYFELPLVLFILPHALLLLFILSRFLMVLLNKENNN